MKRFPVLCSLGFILVLCVPIAIRVSMAKWITQELYAFLNDNTQISLDVDRIKFGILPGVIRIESLKLNNEKSVLLEIDHVRSELSLWSFFVERRIKFSRIECRDVRLEFDNRHLRKQNIERSPDFLTGLFTDIVGLWQQTSVFRGDYFDSLQMRNFQVYVKDRLNDRIIDISLHADYVGISQVDLENTDALVRVEAYGYGLNDLVKDFHLSFFILSEKKLWGHFKVNHLDLSQVDAYLNSKQNSKILKGFFSMSMLTQKLKDSLRVQMMSQLEDVDVELLRQTVRLKQMQTYLMEKRGQVELNFIIDQPPQGTIVDNLSLIVEEFKREFKRKVLTPSKDKDGVKSKIVFAR